MSAISFSGTLFTKRTDILRQDLVKSRSREIQVKIFPIALKFDRHLDSNAAEMPVISERCDHYNIQSRGVETLRDLAVRVRRLTAWWIEALILWSLSNDVSVNSDSSGPCPWWRHQMETFSALLALCAGNSLVPGEFPAQRPVTRNFDVSFDLSLNKRLSKQSWGWWSETPSSSLWLHSNALIDIDLSGDGSCKCTVMQRRRLGVNRDWGGGGGGGFWESPANMMTSWHDGNAFRFTSPCVGSHRSPMDSPHKWPVMRIFDVFFVVPPNNLLNKQPGCRWFKVPWSLCDVTGMNVPGCNVKSQSPGYGGGTARPT